MNLIGLSINIMKKLNETKDKVSEIEDVTARNELYSDIQKN